MKGPWDTNVTGQPSVTNPQSSILDMKTSAQLYVRAGIDLHKGKYCDILSISLANIDN